MRDHSMASKDEYKGEMKMRYYAHTKGDDPNNWQTVKDHLTSTARQAAEFGKDAGLSEFHRLTEQMHNLE